MQAKKSAQGAKTKPVENPPETTLEDMITSLCLAGAITTEVITILRKMRTHGNKKEREFAEKVFQQAATRCQTRFAVDRLMNSM